VTADSALTPAEAWVAAYVHYAEMHAKSDVMPPGEDGEDEAVERCAAAMDALFETRAPSAQAMIHKFALLCERYDRGSMPIPEWALEEIAEDMRYLSARLGA